MPFTSAAFFLFLIVSARLYRLVPAPRRAAYLAAISLLYYLSWQRGPALLLFGAAAVAHRAGLGLRIGTEGRRQARLAAAAVVLLGTLALFKALGAPSMSAVWRLAAPIGISYYTFKLVGYLIDVHWEKMEPEADFFSLLAYAAFFPQILGGPIQRPVDFRAQLAGPPPDAGDWIEGGRRILFGLFQKIAVADRLAPLVGQVFARPEAYGAGAAWFAVFGYALQLYADFSGITDIALGAGRLFGVRGPENFARPFLAANVQEFWRRWHISLSSWFGDYVFLPLRMALRNWDRAGLALSVFAMMLGIGLWHGVRWNFAAFGVLNGLMLAASALTLPARKKYFARHPGWAAPRAVLAPATTTVLMSLAFVFVRADGLAAAVALLRRLFAPGAFPSFGLTAADGVTLGASLLLMESLLAVRAGWRPSAAARLPGWIADLGYYAALLFFLLVSRSAPKQFIYFQF